MEDEQEGMNIQVNQPTISCSVYRKINLGNYENIDVGATLVVPVDVADPMNLEEVQAKAVETLRSNLAVLSKEIKEIKDSIKGAREASGEGTPKRGSR
jgi:predicted aspartyl protease